MKTIRLIIVVNLFLFLLSLFDGVYADITFYQAPIPFRFGLHGPDSSVQPLEQDVCVYNTNGITKNYAVKITTPFNGFYVNGAIDERHKIPFSVEWRQTGGNWQTLRYGESTRIGVAATLSQCQEGMTNAQIRVMVADTSINAALADLYKTDLTIELNEVA